MAAKCTRVIFDAAGEPDPGLRVQAKTAGTSTVVASTFGTGSAITDNGDGSYTIASLATGTYDWYTGADAGTIVGSLTADVHIDPADMATCLATVAALGAGTTAAAIRTALALVIGTNVQAYDAYLTDWKSYLTTVWGETGPVFPYWKDDGFGWQYPAESGFRTALGLGSAAIVDTTATGEASKIPVHTADLATLFPVRSSHLTANAANHGKFYRMVTASTEGLYYVGVTGSGTYSVQTVEEHAIAGA